MKSTFWLFGHSVSCHCCFEESLVRFATPVTREEADNHIDFSTNVPNRVESYTVLEFLNPIPGTSELVLQLFRKEHDNA